MVCFPHQSAAYGHGAVPSIDEMAFNNVILLSLLNHTAYWNTKFMKLGVEQIFYLYFIDKTAS